MSKTRETWPNPTHLRLCLDVGACNTAVVFHHLQKGIEVPEPQPIAYWPLAPSYAEVKIPSAILFEGSRPVEFGFAATRSPLIGQDCYTLVENFKLLLHPEHMVNDAIRPTGANGTVVRFGDQTAVNKAVFEKPRLPPGVTVDDAYKAFLTYVIKHFCDRFAYQ